MNALPLLKEKLPRLPWPAVANHRIPMLQNAHGGTPPPPTEPPVSPLSYLPHKSL